MEMLVVVVILVLLAALISGGVNRSINRAHAATCMSNLRQIGNLVTIYAMDNNGYFPWARPAETAERDQGWNWNSYGAAPIGNREGWNGRTFGGELPYLAGYNEEGGMSVEEYRRPGSRIIFDCPVGAGSALAGEKGYAMNRVVGGIAGRDDYRLTLAGLPNPERVILIVDNSRGEDPDPYPNTQTPPWFSPSMSGYASWTNTIGFHRHSNKAQMLFADLHAGAMSREQVTLDNIRSGL